MQHAQRCRLRRHESVLLQLSTTRVLDLRVSTHIEVRTWPGFPATPSSPGLPARPVGTRRVLTGYSHGVAHTWPGVPAKPSSPGLPARPRRPRAPSAPGRPWSPSAPSCPAHSRLAQPSPLTAALALPPDSHLRPHSGRYEGCRRSVPRALTRYSGYSPQQRRAAGGRGGTRCTHPGYYRQKRKAGGAVVGTFRSGRYGAWVSPFNRGPSARGHSWCSHSELKLLTWRSSGYP